MRGVQAVWLSTCAFLAPLAGPLAGATLAPVAWSESAPGGADDAELQALVAEALAANPEIFAASDELAAARARPDQASALPDPMASLVYTNDGWKPSLGSEAQTTLGLMAQQNIPLGHKRRLRGELAAREADQAAERLERARLRLSAAVRRAYYGLAEARQLVVIAREQQQIWKEIEAVARARYSVGQGAQQDVLRVQAELTRAEQIETERTAAAEVRLAELNRLVGRAPDTPLAREPAALTVQPIDVTREQALDEARALNPERREVQAGLERDRVAVRVAHSNSVPDLSVQGTYMNRGSLAAMWQAGVGFTLPLNRKSRAAAEVEAKALLRSRERTLQALERDLASRTYERFTLLTAAEKTIALYDQGIIPQDRLSVEAALANYRTGSVPFVAVLEALTTLHADRARLVGMLADHARLRTQQQEASLEATAGATSSSAGIAGPSSPTAPTAGGM